MRIGSLLAGLAMVGVGLVGCGNPQDSCGNKGLVLWPGQSAGEYSFQEVPLRTLRDPYQLKGAAAEIYYESLIGPKGYEGSVVHPRYTRANGVCVPTDAGSSMAVALYAQFERIMDFEDRNGVLDMLSWPRKVGLDIHMRSADGHTHNNAYYIAHADAIAVLPYDGQGVPLALNQGIMAHEHFHGHFQKQVIAALDARLNLNNNAYDSFFYPGLAPVGAKATVDDVENPDLTSARGLNTFVLRAWNEGLADLYGAIYTSNPNFFDDSPGLSDKFRALNQPLVRFMSAESFPKEVNKVIEKGRVEGRGKFLASSLVAYSYQQGSVLARLMYRVAMSGAESPEAFLVHILRRLKDIPNEIAANYETQVMEFEEVPRILLKDFPLNAASCQALRLSLSDVAFRKGFAKCGGR